MHALSLRVMRLSKTPLQPTDHLLLDLESDLCSDLEAATALQQRRESSRQADASGRAHLTSSLDICNIHGVLELPGSFGSLFLGEAFQCYVCISNTSKAGVTAVLCKVELETSRGKALLYDNSNSKANLQPNARLEFIVRHDVKEVGQHTLICSVGYLLADGEKRFLPQFFKFSSANPLSVRTKSRTVHRSVLLEACIENTSRAALVLEQIRFDPAPGLSVQSIKGKTQGGKDEVSDPALANFVKSLQMISPSGGSMNLLYCLGAAGQPATRQLEGQVRMLGKLDIRWRTALGEVGRLQTQPIVASAAVARDFELQASELPASVPVETVFSIKAMVSSNVERRVRDLALNCVAEEEGRVVCLGALARSLPELEGFGRTSVTLQFLALEKGVLRLPDLALVEAGSTAPLDVLNLSVQVE